jgi:hypothetical protein
MKTNDDVHRSSFVRLPRRQHRRGTYPPLIPCIAWGLLHRSWAVTWRSGLVFAVLGRAVVVGGGG